RELFSSSRRAPRPRRSVWRPRARGEGRSSRCREHGGRAMFKEGPFMTVGSLPPEERNLVAALSPGELMASARAIAQWVRRSGTADEAKAFDWIERRLREIGLETARYAHPGLVSWPESASLTLIAGGTAHTIPCGTHGFAAPTPAGGLEGDLVYAGRGSEDELLRAGGRGKIALGDGVVAPNRKKGVEAARAAGSSGVRAAAR